MSQLTHELPGAASASGAGARSRPATLLPLVLTAAAVWPVWPYLLRAYTAPGADPAPALLLGAVLAWSLHRAVRGAAGTSPLVTWIALGIYALGYPFLPPLARALLGLGALGAALVSLPGCGWRTQSGIAALALLAAPSTDTLNFFLGGPLRSACAWLAAGLLAPTGVPAAVEGATLTVAGRLFSVDAPCSGVNGLWAGAVIAAVLALHFRLPPLRTAALLATVAPLCVLGNAWRAAALVQMERLASAGASQPDWAHPGVGLVVFAATVALLAGAAYRLQPRSPASPQCAPVESARGSRLGWGVALAAALAPLWGAGAAGPSQTAAAFPGWPESWQGAPLRRLPARAVDRRWAALAPGPLARFALPDGSELLLAWVDRPTRAVHPAEDCYRGSGYEVTPLPPVRAPLPRWTAGDATSGVWRRFRVERDGRAQEVRGVIVSETGEAYADPSWWWWRTAGPGAQDPGPWWVVTVSRSDSSR
ncbi:MAG: archaeosortase/exosortase family protein [Armatimonadota bacterium]